MANANGNGNVSTIESGRLGKRSKLQYLIQQEPELYRQVIQVMEHGVFDYVACEAFGICQGTFINWMRKGAKAREGIYRTFYLDVCGATARARVVAEMEVKREDPKFWLRFGPGKSRIRGGVIREGWSEGQTPPALEPESIESNTDAKGDTPDKLDQLSKVLVVLEEIGMIPGEVVEGGPGADSPNVRSPEPPRLTSGENGNQNRNGNGKQE